MRTRRTGRTIFWQYRWRETDALVEETETYRFVHYPVSVSAGQRKPSAPIAPRG